MPDIVLTGRCADPRCRIGSFDRHLSRADAGCPTRRRDGWCANHHAFVSGEEALSLSPSLPPGSLCQLRYRDNSVCGVALVYHDRYPSTYGHPFHPTETRTNLFNPIAQCSWIYDGGETCGARRREHTGYEHPFLAASEIEVDTSHLVSCGDANCAECESMRNEYISGRRVIEQRRIQARMDRDQIQQRLRIHATEVQSDEDGARSHQFDPGTCTCEACKFARFEDSSIHDALVRSHTSSPALGWIPRGTGLYWMGVELETQMSRELADRLNGYGLRGVHPVSYDEAGSLRRPDDGFWHAKSDGSVTGPEFASQPATLEVWREYEPELREMFRMLIHAGYRSHDGDRAGMHVSFSTSALENTKHLYRMLGLIHRSPDWSLAMSQRTPDSAAQWAKLHTLRTPEDRNGYCAQVEAGHGLYDRYVALNYPGEQGGHAGGRYEFRLPRGTLRLDRFYKNIEWVAAMIEFTRERKEATASSPKAFMEWVGYEAQSEYPNLWAFIDEKGLLTRRLNRQNYKYQAR